MQPFSLNTVKILIIGAVVYSITLLIPYQYNAIVDTMVRSLVITAVYSLLILSFNVSTEATSIYNNIKRRLIKVFG
ncbi:MAG: hypothetical protein M3512_14660, partial [Bacteroidota bacterium]|nr:hypothetical protein [Bacteroidota bacterium]